MSLAVNNTVLNPEPPTRLSQAQEQLKGDFKQGAGGSDYSRKSLGWNGKMVAAVAIGCLIGVTVLDAVGGAFLGLPGEVGRVVDWLPSHLSSLSSYGARQMRCTGTLGSAMKKIIESVLVCGAFFGKGCVGGALLRKSEKEAMDGLLPASREKILALMGKEGLTEEEIEKGVSKRQATVVSSQAGREFIAASRRTDLHYGSRLGMLVSPLRTFGLFWTSVPRTAVGSLQKSKQYTMISSVILEEQRLKEASKTIPEDLLLLNEFRSNQIDQLVWRTDAMGDAYAAAPEIQVYDRNISILQALLDKKLNPNKVKEIRNQIEVEVLKKYLLIQERLKTNSDALRGKVIGGEGSLIQSLVTIYYDVMKLKNISKEQKGQILEAVSILLTQDPKTDIIDVNALVHNIYNDITFRSGEKKTQWKRRNSVIRYAQDFVECKDHNQGDIVLRGMSGGKTLMTREPRSFLALRLLDIAIVFAHAVPIPGASSGGAGILMLGSVALEKKGG